MESYCINTENKLLDAAHGTRDSHDKTFENYKTSSSRIKECLTQYTSEDKIEALINMLGYNEKHAEKLLQQNNCHKHKKIIGVKECLQPNQETPFQTIISELRNTVMNEYWNKEVGKTRYQIPNLPLGMNPLEVTFGKRFKSEDTVANLFKEKQIESDPNEFFEMYKKSHNSYLPGEQIKRHYQKPFEQNLSFGKSKSANTEGARLKRLLTWINANPTTIVNSNLADFMERSHSRVGEARISKDAYLYINKVHGKPAKQKYAFEKSNTLSNCPINSEAMIQQDYLKYINNLRQKLKIHFPEIPFLDIYEDLLCFDKNYTNILPEDKIFPTLARYKIYIDKTLLLPLLDLLQIRKEKNINYKELLNLLNWKYDFPILPKIQRIPSGCQDYSTTYNTTIGNKDKIDTTCIPTAGILYEDLDKSTAYSLICPNVFTKHGLSPVDLSKLRNKEEIQSIFESIGIKFPNNSFNLLWQEGIKKSGTDNVSVEIFISLLDQYDGLINN